MKRSTMFQGLLILLLIGSLALGLRGKISAIADGMPSGGMPAISPTVSPTVSPTASKTPPKTTAKATTKLPPNIADTVRKDLSKQTGIPANKLQLLQSTPQTWSDGCLGLAKADEMCSQMMVQGWQVVFSSGNQRWVYRTDATGRIYRMEKNT